MHLFAIESQMMPPKQNRSSITKLLMEKHYLSTIMKLKNSSNFRMKRLLTKLIGKNILPNWMEDLTGISLLLNLILLKCSNHFCKLFKLMNKWANKWTDQITKDLDLIKIDKGECRETTIEINSKWDQWILNRFQINSNICSSKTNKECHKLHLNHKWLHLCLRLLNYHKSILKWWLFHRDICSNLKKFCQQFLIKIHT